ncbi:unnamed protein product [Ambrosiozyma monospora]|uniref:Unnamed protein product n=1 Tax=Ambrosiozyma monospora TaxID=43982 RepID=A0ACB5UAL1_AMBMO|nr:unnamed protein product [Ambrosiozyma monospora]
MATVRVFIDCDSDVRLGRWIKRDILEPSKLNPSTKEAEAQQLKTLLNSYLNHSRVEMNQFIFQTKEYADVILPRGAETTGITLIVDGLQPLLTKNRNEEDAESREAVQHSLRNNSLSGPTVSSLENEHFNNKRFFDMN